VCHPICLCVVDCAGDADVKREYLTDGHPLRDLPALTTYQRRGSLQLWQFLIALLENPANTSFIAWTGRGLEFKLVEPEEVSSKIIIVVIIIIIIIIIIKNVLIRVTLHTKVLQGHFTQLSQKHCRSCGTKATD